MVPHTGSRKGIPYAIAAGICYGKAERGLEVPADDNEAQPAMLDEFLAHTNVSIKESDANCPFDIQVKAYAGKNSAYVRMIGNHTNVVSVQYNDQILFSKPFEDQVIQAAENRKLLTVEQITAYADQVDLSAVQDVLERQITYNSAVAKEGMSGNYGAGIGKILMASYGNSVQNRAKAYAAAASDV